MSFTYYKKTDGATSTDVTPPSIIELGGGAYSFTPVFADETKGIFYTLNTGTNANPPNVNRFMRPEDWISDDIQTLIDIETGKWQVFTSGPNVNKMIFYAQDGVTELYSFDLFDAAGNPTFANFFKRVPS